MLSQSENQNTFQCVRTTFGHQRLPFSTKQDLANGWKKLFLETKKTTQQWAMTRSLFANIAFGSNSNPSFVCVRYSIREIFYSSKCTYLPCLGAMSGSVPKCKKWESDNNIYQRYIFLKAKVCWQVNSQESCFLFGAFQPTSDGRLVRCRLGITWAVHVGQLWQTKAIFSYEWIQLKKK